MSKRPLGKGLDALLPALSINEDDKVVEIPLAQLRANPYQPRRNFNDETIQELADSIKEHGVIQPIIVRSVLKGYEIIAGERRFRASQKCGMATVPAVIKKFTDQQVMEIALIENVQREDLNAMEIAIAYQALIDQFSLTQEELSVKVGKSRSHIANFLRLLQLPEEVKNYVSRGTLSMGHAKAIAGLKDKKLMKALADTAIKEQWSVRELEEEVKKLEEKSDSKKAKQKAKRKDPYINELEETLRETYRTTVKIRHGSSNKGKIELLYYSKDDLDRLLELLQGKTS
ncbi:ParB/RepB/Spo0J family partition protein [Paenibacillus mucilaginosus]|uniref:Spo0J-like protein, ParB-like nuclease domain-containing protein n=3 Tax=Paenibacillus mucilaginosus TaxID=61624 RepID=H6NIZ5_9BACL|nr:ParB/RepB/Spo0J family partition protein [Paenibacillus mucilaginosus]AEI46451.1 Spo0J-like protein, ParB-like nuclease domain protein [Paenibacillus mucilaginosus KNP414]AFC34045.1 Spo0J-like protein, ParB-like nuclease domain-containing protein [Paenibacillus mucilaginosus 3016]AFH66373.1 plasmid partitioning protein ParB [Paenibacillus mucilaginosus K02]MCG7213444.1 ParB/RepB/Spo0J family partition protein [Paenibacillus mucilaginosus]WDM27737.1 ParB/RepB/Spo0J family partition protein [